MQFQPSLKHTCPFWSNDPKDTVDLVHSTLVTLWHFACVPVQVHEGEHARNERMRSDLVVVLRLLVS